MSRISVDVSSARIPVLQVGYQGENEVTDVLFDISSWITEFGEGVAQLRVKRPGNSEEESYVLSLTITDGKAVWTVSETDTANKGNGKVQLSYMVGNIVKKAVIYPYKVGKSIVGADNPVDPFDSWIERSKAWAIGETLGGDNVPETDETYQNNAKYYAEQADILGSAQVVLATEQATLATEKATLATEKADAAAASEAAVNGVSTQLTTRMSAIETEQAVQDARMDTFTSLPEGSTSGNAELADIRVGSDGTTYDTAGNAVRGQIGELKSGLKANTNCEIYQFTEGKYIDTSGTSVNINNPGSSDEYRYAVADCTEGDEFYITGKGSIISGLWTFIGSDWTIITQSTTTSKETDLKITAPANSAYLVVNSNITTVKCVKGIPLVDRVSANEVTISRNSNDISIMKESEQRGNVFEAKTGYITGKYYYRLGPSLAVASNASNNGFIIPVIPHSEYRCVQSNIVLLDANKKPLEGSSSWDYQAVTHFNSDDAEYVAVSYNTSDVPTEGYGISMGGSVNYDAYSLNVYAKSYYVLRGQTGKTIKGDIADGGKLSIGGRTALKDGQQIVFRGNFSSFSELTVNFVTSQNYVKITSTNLVICNTSGNTITQAHGLTLSNHICLLLEIKKSHMYIKVISMGVTYTYECFWNQTDGAVTSYEAEALGMSFTDVSFSSNYSACKRKIWYFGDSYIAYETDTRIPYYMVENGFDENVAFCGSSGGTSGRSIDAFSTMLNYGKPSLAILATGMNNGSDSSSSPRADWLKNVNIFINMCKSFDIEPILCTVPTVPTVNNEKKNEWVRSSGYRYIDYAKAVGAQSDGTWYSGMLSSDDIHPSTLGGNALFTQLISDCPEVMG